MQVRNIADLLQKRADVGHMTIENDVTGSGYHNIINAMLKVLGKSAAVCKTTTRKGEFYVRLLGLCMENHL